MISCCWLSRNKLCFIFSNAANLLFKAGGWLYSGSHSMFAEVIHSLADLVNQLILAFGIYKSAQEPDTDHPYGYMNMRYVSSLISGVGIFCVGSGLSIYHGIEGILHPEPIGDLFWVYCILAGSLVSEGATLVVAFNELLRSARLQNMSFKDYGKCLYRMLMGSAYNLSALQFLLERIPV